MFGPPGKSLVDSASQPLEQTDIRPKCSGASFEGWSFRKALGSEEREARQDKRLQHNMDSSDTTWDEKLNN